MKYCPFCGEAITEESATFCSECGKPLPERKAAAEPASAEPPKEKPKKQEKSKPSRKEKKARKAKQSAPPIEEDPIDDGYDGYYEDRIPADEGNLRQRVNKNLIRNIILLLVGLLFAVGACVAIMYLL